METHSRFCTSRNSNTEIQTGALFSGLFLSLQNQGLSGPGSGPQASTFLILYSCCSCLGSNDKRAHGDIPYAFVVPDSQGRARHSTPSTALYCGSPQKLLLGNSFLFTTHTRSKLKETDYSFFKKKILVGFKLQVTIRFLHYMLRRWMSLQVKHPRPIFPLAPPYLTHASYLNLDVASSRPSLTSRLKSTCQEPFSLYVVM